MKDKFLKTAPFLIIVLVIILVFGKSIHFNYVYFDDDTLILKSFSFISNPRNIPSFFVQDGFNSSGYFSTYYKPIQTISFMMDSLVCGKIPVCYHIDNLLLHIIFCFLLYVFLIRLGIKKWISFLLVLIFSVDPAIISNVAWIPGRNDVLLGIFFLSSFLFFDRWLEKNKKLNLVLFALFFNFALYTKELTVLFIPLILFYILWKKKWEIFKGRAKIVFIIWFLSLFVWFILREFAIVNAKISLSDQLSLKNMPGILLYIGKIIPYRLSIIPTLKDSSVIPGLVILSFSLLLLYFYKGNKKMIIFGYVWFFLLISVAITQPGTVTNPFFLEHRIYIPLVGVLIAIGSIFSAKKWEKRPLIVAAICVSVFFSLITFNRIDYYRNIFSFNSQAIIESPHLADPYAALGYAYIFDINNPQKARKLYEQALVLDPYVPYAHTNLGVILINEGKYPEAVAEIMKEARLRNNDYTLLQLGRAYYAQKKLDKALSAWEKGYAISPNYLPIIIDLALVNADLGKYKEAKQYYLRAVALGGLEGQDKTYLEKLKFLENY